MDKLKKIVGLCLVVIIIASCNTKSKSKLEQPGVVSESMQKENIQFDKAKIFQAALDGNIQVVQDALENGFDPNTVDENTRTALMLAAYNGHTAIVQLLIDREADVNFADEIQRTALMYASSGPFVNTVLALLHAGAKPNLTEKEQNWTAAMMAAAEGQLEVLKTLVAFGADLSLVDVDGESSLDFADSKGYSDVSEYIKNQIGR
ncbi:ankyrin repeat domain-containing protein [Mangrovibacterium lignilyticum]|uniref:ankyrin repeat domain-containing protein n=1 Tax=Mangrovibacterium lignilyticum TaxID=2668052 RepID=UPI0013D161B6|nr:ankyrin repeat domain-containing protein [Mangrovibacterium lignilyticum]